MVFLTWLLGVSRGDTWLFLLDLVEVRDVASFPEGPSVSCRRVFAAAAECACCERGCCFARAVVGFVFGLRVRVGVSRGLSEPTCGVAFTSVGLLPVDPVEGCVLVGCVFGLVCLCTVGCCPLLRRHLYSSYADACVPCCTAALLEFLLLRLVRDWLYLLSLVREAHPPTLFR
ncbi:hypothetical protein Taro_007493 [Colocasia esculenta]|uniref:Uncharacterized protein n=1 Tax=Colocasia esculenta TaxID=4460 RepID=A0A843TZV0_COLES|nr:hypothetical protein [Colocasia esculenta]